ncbi:MAG: hypothetical protein ABMA25_00645 [Ilumatobacteraceae bacterium]
MTNIDADDPELLDELGIELPEPVNRYQRRHPRQVAQLTDKQKRLVRRAHEQRRRHLREVCRQHGLHSSVRLVEAIVHYQELTDLYRPGDLANPSQLTLARRAGWNTDDTVRKHLYRLEEVGILTRYVPWPTRHNDGTYTRATTRYHLRDKVAGQLLRSPACPLPQRHPRTPPDDLESPTPNNFGVNSLTGGKEARRPVDEPTVCVQETSNQIPKIVGAPTAHPPTADSPAVGPPWRNHPGGYSAWLAAQH